MNADKIKSIAHGLTAEVTEFRRYLHAHPEVSWQEVETSKLIEKKLGDLGLENIRRGFGGEAVGVTADLIGDPNGPRVALRADIDALPMTEKGTAVYRSCKDGAMHACGHDGHISTLYGVAKLLQSVRGEIPGCIRFIFQPAEEHGIRSGAKEMIAGGALEGVDAIGGMHLWSFVETGRVQWRNGAVMASADSWNTVFTGKGGHGAMPHEAIDPTVVAASFIGSLQTIVSREINPTDTAVVSLGKLIAGDAFNIIPASVDLLGTIRTFSRDVRMSMEERVNRIANGVAAAYRCTAETKFVYMYPSVINDLSITKILRDTAESVVGSDMVEESPMLMVSEDFSYYQEKVPGTFYFLGAGNAAKDANHPHHSPYFDIDEDVLPIGISIMSAFAFATLEKLK